MTERFYPGWGIMLLRIGLGSIFLVHGWDKLFVGDGVATFEEFLVARSFPATAALAWIIAIVEFLGGLFLLVGWLTRWVAGVLFLEMLVALAAVHARHGFSVFQPFGEWGYEYHLIILASLGCLILSGAGVLAVDEWLGRRGAPAEMG